MSDADTIAPRDDAARLGDEHVRTLLERAEAIAKIGHYRDDLITGELYWSPGLYAISGVDPATPAKDVANLFAPLVPTHEATRLLTLRDGSAAARRSYSYETTLHRPDGGRRMIFNLALPEFDEAGLVRAFFGVIRDVTDERVKEKALSELTRQYERAEGLARLFHSYEDFGTGTLHVSPMFYEIMGREPGSGVIPVTELLDALETDTDRERSRARRDDVARRGVSSSFHTRFRRASDDAVRTLAVDCEPERDDAGAVIGQFAIVRDITEAQYAERSLYQTNRLLDRAQRLSGVGHCYDDYVNDVLTGSDNFFAIYGVDTADAPASFTEMIALVYRDQPDRRASAAAAREAVKRHPHTVFREFDIVRPLDGEHRHLRIEAEPDFDAHGRLIGNFAIVQDVTEVRRSERALRRREAFVENAQKAASAAPYRLDVETRRFTGSLLIRRFFGWVGAAPAFVPLEDVYASMVSPIDVERATRALAEAIDTQSPFAFEYSIRRESDGAVRHLRTRAEPEIRPDGTVRAFLGVLLDVTAEVDAQRERDQLERAVERAQRVEALGFFAGGLAHEVRNVVQPLPLIAGRLRKLLETGDLHGALRDLDDLELASNRALTSVRGMLAFISSEQELSEVHRLGDLMVETERFLRAAVTARLSFATTADAADALVRVGRTGFLQVAVNLVQNAVEAGGPNVAVSVSADVAETPATDTTALRRAVVVSVEDNGPGIPPGMLGRIFEPFYSGKKDLDGSGLGLAVINNLVSRWGGRVTVDAPRETGARFDVEIPIAEG